MQLEKEIHSELAIHDLQRRLATLGYRLGEEADKGLFGERTAAAVTSFKVSNGLGNDDTLDQTTWTALKDATMQLGDRPLYLHIPHFRGRDVSELQGALSSMGFACAVNNIFGAETEHILREFQRDMGLRPTGILDQETFATMNRLRHVWEGKRGFPLGGRIPVPARCLEVLETTPVCIFGIDEPTRVIANRVANLARATTLQSRVLSASALETAPKKDMLLLGLRLDESGLAPGDYLDNKELAVNDLASAIRDAQAKDNRLTLVINAWPGEGEDLTLKRQEIATWVLDTLCLALARVAQSD